MNTNNISPHLLIALPRLLCFKTLFNETLDSVLTTLGKIDTSVISDRAGDAKKLLTAKGINPFEVRISSRLEAKSEIKKYSHVLVFWDGEEQSDILYYAKLFNKHVRIVPVKVTKVRNKDKDEDFDVYIGRGTLFGNPFPIEHEPDGNKRKVVIEKFRVYFHEEIVSNPEKLKVLLSLKGLRLGCHCKPLPCHGDVIADFLNSYEEISEKI